MQKERRMLYKVVIDKRAVKMLEGIHEPYYSALKSAILSLANEPRPSGCKKLKVGSLFGRCDFKY